MKILVYNILWNATEEEKKILPNNCILTVQGDFEQFIGDSLTSKYGFKTKGFFWRYLHCEDCIHLRETDSPDWNECLCAKFDKLVMRHDIPCDDITVQTN